MAVTSSDSTTPPIGDTGRWLKWIALRSHIASRQVRSCDGVPARVRGIVSPGTAAFGIAAKPGPARSPRPQLFWNAFGTPAEEAADPRWASASPINLATRAIRRSCL